MLKELAQPFSLLLVGKSGVGKTYLTTRLLHHVHSNKSPSPKYIIYCYAIWQPAYVETYVTYRMLLNAECTCGGANMYSVLKQTV